MNGLKRFTWGISFWIFKALRRLGMPRLATCWAGWFGIHLLSWTLGIGPVYWRGRLEAA
jgi:hypothetical protein